jgi:hypothetical protein
MRPPKHRSKPAPAPALALGGSTPPHGALARAAPPPVQPRAGRIVEQCAKEVVQRLEWPAARRAEEVVCLRLGRAHTRTRV